MIRRLFALVVILWLFGFVAFIIALPDAAPADLKSDGIVVLTGGKGRIERGIEMLSAGNGKRMLVSGVFPKVSATELATVQKAPLRLFKCCIDLGKQAVDTRSNAEETAQWLVQNDFHSVRLITSDWHMPRARFEIERELRADIVVVADAVETTPALSTLFIEYNKFLARHVSALFGY
ncbi:MAG: YdcF family protein [Sphingomonadaceae bacterium]